MSWKMRFLVVLGVVAISAVVAVLYFTPSHFAPLAPPYGYARIEVTSTQAGFYRPGNDPHDGWYDFSYYSTSFINPSFIVNPEFGPSRLRIGPDQIFPLTEGANYSFYGLQMTVSEVHSDYFVLLVRNIS